MADQALPLRRTRRAGRTRDIDDAAAPIQDEHAAAHVETGAVSAERASPALTWLLFTVAAALIATGVGVAAYTASGDWLFGLGVSGPAFLGARLFSSLVLKA